MRYPTLWPCGWFALATSFPRPVWFGFHDRDTRTRAQTCIFPIHTCKRIRPLMHTYAHTGMHLRAYACAYVHAYDEHCYFPPLSITSIMSLNAVSFPDISSPTSKPSAISSCCITEVIFVVDTSMQVMPLTCFASSSL